MYFKKTSIVTTIILGIALSIASYSNTYSQLKDSIDYFYILVSNQDDPLLQSMKKELDTINIKNDSVLNSKETEAIEKDLWLCFLPYDIEKLRNYLIYCKTRISESNELLPLYDAAFSLEILGDSVNEILDALNNSSEKLSTLTNDRKILHDNKGKKYSVGQFQTVFRNIIRAVNVMTKVHPNFMDNRLDEIVDTMSPIAKKHVLTVMAENVSDQQYELLQNAISAVKTALDPEHMLIPAPSVRNLVFEGGGPRGLAYVGVLDEIKELLSDVERVGGSSIGAITALFVSAGITPERMQNILSETSMMSLTDPHGNAILSTIKCFTIGGTGIYKGEKIREWLKNTIRTEITSNIQKIQNDKIKCLNDNNAIVLSNEERVATTLDISSGITFKQFHQLVEWDRKNGKKLGLKDFYVVVADITELDSPKTVVMSHENNNFKNISITDATQFSAAAPMMFDTVKIIDSNGIKHVFTDGGVVNGFPIDIFENKAPLGYLPAKGRVNSATLGFLVDTKNEMVEIGGELEQAVYQPDKVSGGTFKYYAGRLSIYWLYGSAVSKQWNNNRLNTITKYSAAGIEQVYDRDVSQFHYDLTQEEKNALIASGRKVGAKIMQLRGEKQLIQKGDVINSARL